MRFDVVLKSKSSKTRKFLDIFSCMKPFSDLTERDKTVLAKYIDEYLSKIKTMSPDDANKLIFDYDFTRKVSNELTERYNTNISIESVRNYISRLRKKSVINEREIDKNIIDLFGKLDDEITFKLKFKDE